jgi:hypothetical protein
MLNESFADDVFEAVEELDVLEPVGELEESAAEAALDIAADCCCTIGGVHD